MKMSLYKLITRDFIIKSFSSDFILENNYFGFKTELNNPRFSLNKKRHSSKNIIMWEKYGLIKDNRKENRGWKKYSFTQVVWIDLIKRLKHFGLKSKRLLEIKKMLNNKNDEAKICQFPILDFYIKLIIFEQIQVFFITDGIENSFLITKNHLNSLEQLSTYDYGDMIRININRIVLDVLIELPIKFNSNFSPTNIR